MTNDGLSVDWHLKWDSVGFLGFMGSIGRERWFIDKNVWWRKNYLE